MKRYPRWDDRRVSALAHAAILTTLGGCAVAIPEPPPPLDPDPAARVAVDRPKPSKTSILSSGVRRLTPPPFPAGRPQISWTPRRPLQGAALKIRIRDGGPRPAGLQVRVAGREVSLARREDGWIGLVALPIDSAGPLELVARFGGEPTTGHELVVIARNRRYASTRLRVAPRGEDRPEVQARIRREQERIRAALRETSPDWVPRGAFEWPRPPEFTSPFGQRRVFNGVTRSRHLGLDLSGSRGTPVRAPAAARVVLVGDFFYQGNAVYLDHGLGLVTAYFHLSRLDVREGDVVEAGQLLGRVGSTGRSTAPHLHWSAYVNGHNVDPASLIGLDLEIDRDRPDSRAAGGPRQSRE